ncbi:hypothetical protein PBI_121Q_129 [Escherichia phage 121Q]|uniref:Uncharacterized protein n=1 Tax=Escherichia phage 121Q TaxID=1555202 RepID=A0A097EX82_9CAUD|nr:hypothetical protein PBI_121Q_129 [Escherichia phage 121Q]AIT14023.1 hypothetical protein PBI_121Q_129 [Escherichia phage 121Q]
MNSTIRRIWCKLRRCNPEQDLWYSRKW